ncbi:hypothetical protein [Streptomyces sp. NPDC096153]|uniref:LppU/SCO3897 family protein n=1 Tax=Streptomyces sp. NPDC096153 TaxID=3155548 RepID=UPI00332DE649
MLIFLGLAGLLAIAVVASRDDANFAKVGDCVNNEGTAALPDMTITSCSDGTADYKVIEILPNTTDTQGCRKVAGVQSAYTYQSKTKQVVLCLGPID